MIDTAPLLEAILATEASGLAKEESARLLEGFLEHESTLPERVEGWKVVGAEIPFYVPLEEKSYVIGVADAIFDTPLGIVIGEWKSRRAPKLKKDGAAYAGDDEDGWLEDISGGAQLAFYALAAAQGSFLTEAHSLFANREPRILVRAIVKSSPVQLWPRDWRKGMFQFFPAGIDAARNSLTVKCRQIRAARASGLVPWQIPGEQCTNQYRRVCGNRDGVCRNHIYPPQRTTPNPDESETRKLITEVLQLDAMDPELVMLSASGFGAYTQCMELGRQRYEAEASGAPESSFELEIGSCLHVALASFYRGLM